MFSYSNASENLIEDFVLDPTFRDKVSICSLIPHLVIHLVLECQGYRAHKGQMCLHTPSVCGYKPNTSLAPPKDLISLSREAT